MELFFDTETSDLINFKARDSDPSQPWVVQLAAALCEDGEMLMSMCLIIQSEGLPMTSEALKVHGITPELADRVGYQPGYAFNLFHSMVTRADVVIAHNKAFDIRLIAIMAKRLTDISEGQSLSMLEEIKGRPSCCTMQSSTKFCALPYPSGKAGNKWPKLEELHIKLFGCTFDGAHDALEDVKATMRCYYELKRLGVIE